MSEIKDFFQDDNRTWSDHLPGSVMILPRGQTGVLNSGWLYCSGATLNRTTYNTLYNAIGTRYGTTNYTNFKLPDYRGLFIRGWAHGTWYDPDRNSRNSGYTNGDLVGSIQEQQIVSHNHQYYMDNNFSNNEGWADRNDRRGQWASSSANGTAETRPKNYAMIFVIKYL